MPWNAYIDESGDRGWTFPEDLLEDASSTHFSMTAVLVPEGSEGPTLAAWNRAKRSVGRRPGDVLHWVNVRSAGQRQTLIKGLVDTPDIRVISVVLCKPHLPNVAVLTRPVYLYNWTLRLMLERLSWFGEQYGTTVAPTFSQVGRLPRYKLDRYVAKIRFRETYIAWEHLKLPLQIDTPANRHMLQIADAASGAIFAAFEPDAGDRTDQTYVEFLMPVLWRRWRRHLWADGLKHGP